MDERQTQIKEGAGLDESRLNEDLINFLEKWSAPFLFALALIMAGYWGYGYLQRKQAAHVAEAFGAYSSAVAGDNPSPDSLKRVADEYADVVGAAAQARLRAARVYMEAVWYGMEPGTQLAPDGSLASEDDGLTPEEIENYLAAADEQYRLVLDDTRGDEGKWVLTLNALWGRAAVAASRGDLDTARGFYREIEQLETAQGDGLQARLAARMAERIGDYAEAPKLFGPDELPPIVLQGSEDPVGSLDAIVNPPTNDEAPVTDGGDGVADDGAGEATGEQPAPVEPEGEGTPGEQAGEGSDPEAGADDAP